MNSSLSQSLIVYILISSNPFSSGGLSIVLSIYFFLNFSITISGTSGDNSFKRSNWSFINLSKSFGLILLFLGNPNSTFTNLYNLVYSKYEFLWFSALLEYEKYAWIVPRIPENKLNAPTIFNAESSNSGPNMVFADKVKLPHNVLITITGRSMHRALDENLLSHFLCNIPRHRECSPTSFKYNSKFFVQSILLVSIYTLTNKNICYKKNIFWSFRLIYYIL